MKVVDLTIVGLGIVGASAAYAATRAGARVVGFDAGVAGEGTSGTSFAWLNSVRKEPEAYHRLNADGMAAHVDLARELGVATGHHPGGSLEWADGEASRAELRDRVARLAQRGYPAEWIERDRALAMPDDVPEVTFYAADAWLDAPRLIRALLAEASRRGAEIREHAPVRSVRVRGRRLEALEVDDGPVIAAAVLVCVGPATQAFLSPLGVQIPVG